MVCALEYTEAIPHAASVLCHQQHFVVNDWAGTVNDFLICPCYLMAQFTDLPCFWRKSHQKCWRKSCSQPAETCGSSMMGLQLTLHVRSENISPPLTTIAGNDRAGQWLGLPCHQTSHQCTSSYGDTLKPFYMSPVDSEEDLIACTVEAVATIRQQPLAFLSAHQSLLCTKVGGHMFEHLLYGTKYNFFQNTSVVLLNF